MMARRALLGDGRRPSGSAGELTFAATSVGLIKRELARRSSYLDLSRVLCLNNCIYLLELSERKT